MGIAVIYSLQWAQFCWDWATGPALRNLSEKIQPCQILAPTMKNIPPPEARPLTVRLDPELRADLQAEADDLGTNLSDLIRGIAAEYLEQRRAGALPVGILRRLAHIEQRLGIRGGLKV
jgi:Ribbon-helix-helix protein, copG family